MAHALVFGASGTAGWAVVDQLLRGYPSKGTFTKVTALFNRPMTFEETHWPDPSSQGIEFQMKFGTDLTSKSLEDVILSLKENVPGIETVTNAFYFAYKPPQNPTDLKEEVDVNGQMLQNAVNALNELSPQLTFLSLLTGSKAYGVTLPERRLQPPFNETMVLPEPELSLTFYTRYREILTAASEGKSWTWTDIRPDLIIGFEPRHSHFNMASHWGRWLTAYAAVHGRGAKIPFPGVDAAYRCLANNCSSERIARLATWASLHPEKCGNGEAFNIADNADPQSFEVRWPAIVKYFGLEGISPAEAGISKAEDIDTPSAFLTKHKDAAKKVGLEWDDSKPPAAILDAFGVYMTFDRQVSIDKVIKAGFTEEVDPNESWFKVWDKLKEAGMLPT